MNDAVLNRKTLMLSIAASFLIVWLIHAFVQKTLAAETRIQSERVDDLRIATGYNHLLSLQADRAILSCTTPLVEELSSQNQNKKRIARYLTLIGRAFDFDNNTKAASTCYLNALCFDPDYTPAKAFLAFNWLGSDKHARAEQFYEQLDRLADTEVIASQALGKRAMKHADFKAACAFFKAAVDLNPNLASSHRLLAKCYANRGFSMAGSAEFKRAAQLEKSSYLQEMFSGKSAEISNKNQEAEQHYLAAGKILPEDPDWHYQLFFLYLGQNNKDAALPELEKTASCRRLSTKALETLALYYSFHNQSRQAKKVLDFAASRNPESSGPMFTRAHWYVANKKPQLAIEQFKKAIYKDRLNIWAHYGLAEQLKEQSNPREARSVISACLSHSPAFRQGWQTLGDLESNDKEWGKALKAYRKIEADAVHDKKRKDLTPARRREIALLYARLADCYFNLKNLPRAIESAIEFNQVKPLTKRQVSFKALSVRPGRLDHGVPETGSTQNKAVEHVALADMFYENGNLEECCNQYRQALALVPDNVEFRKYLFHALTKNHMWLEAAKEDIVISNQIIKGAPSFLKKSADAMRNTSNKKAEMEGPVLRQKARKQRSGLKSLSRD